jgi:hypothetical protein
MDSHEGSFVIASFFVKPLEAAIKLTEARHHYQSEGLNKTDKTNGSYSICRDIDKSKSIGE